MKILITTFLFSWFLISTCGQKKHPNELDRVSTFKIESGKGIIPVVADLLFSDSLGKLALLPDSSVYIEGDTMAMIKLVLHFFKKCNEESTLYRQRFDTAKSIYIEQKNKSNIHW